MYLQGLRLVAYCDRSPSATEKRNNEFEEALYAVIFVIGRTSGRHARVALCRPFLFYTRGYGATYIFHLGLEIGPRPTGLEP